MKKRTVTLLVSLAVVIVSVLVIDQFSAPTNTQANKVASATASSLMANFADLPMSFESISNKDSQTSYFSRGRGHGIVVDETGIKLQLRGKSITSSVAIVHENAQKTTVEGEKELPGKVNYFIGNDPKEWKTNIPTYEKVRSQDIYPGIDLVCYGNQDSMEFDYVVSPNTDPSQIEFSVNGADNVSIADNGDLLISIDGEEIRQKKPVSYQTINSKKISIESSYQPRSGDMIGFKVGDYDPSSQLTIDPVLLYATYLGGNNGEDYAQIAIDNEGYMYVVAGTTSTTPPIGALYSWDTSSNGDQDILVSKLSPNGGTLIYTSFIGGSGGDHPEDVSVDSYGNAYVTGSTQSAVFPTTLNAFQENNPGGPESAVVVKFSPDGTQLLYSTYLGGSGTDVAYAIAATQEGYSYIGGFTTSSNFPVLNAIDGSYGYKEAFVTELSPDGQTAIFSTFLDNGYTSKVLGLSLGDNGDCYFAIETQSPTLPTPNGAQTFYGGSGDIGKGDVYIGKLSGDGQQLLYGTYLGGSGDESPFGIDVDSAGNCVVSGWTRSTNFPTVNALQPSYAGNWDCFVTKVSPTGSSFVFSTYLGDTDEDWSFDVAVDDIGYSYVTGRTRSVGFPTINATQPQHGGDLDSFLTIIDPLGAQIEFSTFYGGTSTEQGLGIVEHNGNIYVSGITQSLNLPTLFPYQGTINGWSDSFIVVFGPPPIFITPFPSIADSYIKKGPPNANQGMETVLTVQTGGKNRSLVSFDQSAIASAIGTKTVLSAKLRVYVSSNLGLWDQLNPGVSVHRMITSWTELGATWNCPNDTNTSNSQPDGPLWEMMNSSLWPFLAMATDTVLFDNTTSGWVEFDVTDDLQQFLSGTSNFGWIIRKDDEGITGGVQFFSKEGTNPPELVVTYQ